MLAELRCEQFKTVAYEKSVSPRYPFSAVRDLPGLPCRLFWTIQRNSDAGTIVEIDGAYLGTCL
jgi:hypothetical protein